MTLTMSAAALATEASEVAQASERIRPEAFEQRDGRLVRSIGLRNGDVAHTDLGRATVGRRDLADLADQRFLRLSERAAILGGRPVRIVDLFCGCGALTLGAVEASRAVGRRSEIVLAADLEQVPLEVYSASLGAPKAIRQGDLALHLNGELGTDATEAERAFLRDCPAAPEICLAGPPCQGHSSLNNHTRHNDERNDLYLRVVRFAELRMPKLCIIENVASIMRDERRSVEHAVAHLKRLGYHVDHGTIPLDRLGVPQRRRRHVVLACAPGEPRLVVEDVVAAYSVDDPTRRTVEWAVGDLGDLDEPGPFDLPSRPSSENAARMRRLHRHQWIDLPNKHRPPCHREPKLNDDGSPRPHKYKSMYGRLSWDKPAQTITSGYGSMGQGRYVHPAHPRTITPHEAARLQFFPDFYAFDLVDRRGQWARMIGNAAPMKLSYVFALEALR